MNDSRYFLDTVYIQALLNRRDQYHDWAVSIFPQLQNAAEVWVTEAVLMEVGNALSSSNRRDVVMFIQQCYGTPNIRVVPVDTVLFQQAVQLYANREDKQWGLIDCISFVTMKNANIQIAATVDHHFVQAGFDILYIQ